MFNFSSKKADIFRAVKTPFFVRKASFFKEVFFWVFSITFALYIFGFFREPFWVINPERLLGLALFSFFVFLLFWYLSLFFKFKLKKPKTRPLEEVAANLDRVNLAEYFNYEAAKILRKTLSSNQKSDNVLLYYLLKNSSFSQFVFSRLLVDQSRLIDSLESWMNNEKNKEKTEELKKVISLSLSEATKRDRKKIRAEDLLIALFEVNNFLDKFLIEMDLQKEEVTHLIDWHVRVEKKRKKEERFWNYENLLKKGTLGRDWIAGATYLLEDFSLDWSNYLRRRGFREIVGHSEEVESVERVLSSGSGNVILVGKPGVGRSSVVNEVARKCFLGISNSEINHNRILKLNLQSLIAQVEGREATEKVLDKLFQEAIQAGNVIIAIEDLQEYVADQKNVGVVDISGVLSPYLNNPRFKFIGITNYQGYRGVIEKKQAVNNYLEKVELEETTKKETLQLCEMLTPGLEEKYNVFVSYQALKACVDYGEEFLTNESFPEKSMELLEEAVVEANQKGKEVLEKEGVAELVSEKAEVPVGKVKEEEKSVLLNLEEKIHERVVNQHEAVSEISRSLRRSRAKLDTRSNLIGSFLFLGPTGVGKTETAKAVSEAYFESEENIIRLDMSEYQSVGDVSRLIGTENQNGVLTEQVLEDPFSLVLLDEIEKAHKDVLNVFLQVLDEGHVTDGMGREIDFRNCMIIATSNAGYQKIMEAMEEGTNLENVKEDILKGLFREGVFRPEFVNRFDATVLFEPLSEDDLVKIAQLQLEDLKNDLKDQHIEFIITKELKEKIVEISYEPMFGAREMQRVIQNKIGDKLASAILSEEVTGGDKVEINPEDFTIEKIN